MLTWSTGPGNEAVSLILRSVSYQHVLCIQVPGTNQSAQVNAYSNRNLYSKGQVVQVNKGHVKVSVSCLWPEF